MTWILLLVILDGSSGARALDVAVFHSKHDCEVAGRAIAIDAIKSHGRMFVYECQPTGEGV